MSNYDPALTAFGINFFYDNDSIVEAANNVADELFADAGIDRFENEELFDDFRYEYLEDAIEDALQVALDSMDMPALYRKWGKELSEWAK